MNIMKYVPNKVTSTIARQVLVAQKNSPTILFGFGVVGVIATVVLASRATLKLDEVLETTQKKLIELEAGHSVNHKGYSEQDYKKDVTIVYVQSSIAIAKMYGPAFIVGVVSIGSLASSHHILTTRNAGLMAAYAAVQNSFSEYRQRVLKDVGPDKEREFRYGSEVVTVIDEETGKKCKELRVDPDNISMYARFFTNESDSWNPPLSYNLYFLRSQQNYLNDMLHARGHVFLNEAYDRIGGIDRTPEGQLVGWVMNNGDNYIDFGIDNNENLKLITTDEGHILLDFNVDGVVYDLIGKD